MNGGGYQNMQEDASLAWQSQLLSSDRGWVDSDSEVRCGESLN